MSEMGESLSGLESALGAAFGDAPPKQPVAPVNPVKQARAPEPDEVEGKALDTDSLESEAPSLLEDPADLLAGQDVEEEAVKEPETEPEFEIEIEPGKPEVLPLARLKELAARGAKAGRGFEENARVREALQAQVQQTQFQQQFHQAVSQDIAHIQALDQQLQAYDKYDWNAAYDSNPFEALKLKEQRDQLREQRAAAIRGFEAKRQQFDAHLKESAQKVLAAEQEALLAKVPAWRNPEKAKAEHGEIATALTSHYGFTEQEAQSVMDHRMILVARDAAAYRKLLANKDAKVKQAREAPATAKPGNAAAQPNGRAEFAKTKNLLKAHGAKGNHRAQENIAAAMFEKAFK